MNVVNRAPAATQNPPGIPDLMPANLNPDQNSSMHTRHKAHSGSHFMDTTAQGNMMKYGTCILLLLCVAVPAAYAKNEGHPISQSLNAQYERQFNTELFSKCNVCHKPFESTVVGSRTIPPYTAMSNMGEEAIKNGIEHGGHISNADKSRIYSVLHPAAGSGQATKKTGKKARKASKHGKSKHRK